MKRTEEKMKVMVQQTGEVVCKCKANDKLIEHVVGPVVFRIYCTKDGVSVHTDKRDGLDDGCWECQMNLGIHGNAYTSPAVDITVERTDR
jgi:hypothetical protein